QKASSVAVTQSWGNHALLADLGNNALDRACAGDDVGYLPRVKMNAWSRKVCVRSFMHIIQYVIDGVLFQ
ncbi:hypothetical protein ACK305_15225, partial [Aeromonas caviae]